MTGDDHADGVGAVGESDGADGIRSADAAREFAVADGLGGGNVAEGAPDFALKGSACGGGEDVVDGMDVAGEVGGEAGGEAGGIALVGERVAAFAVMDIQQAQ